MKKIFLILFFAALLDLSHGQINNLTFQFNNILFSDLVDTLEKKIPVKIFYAEEWVDSLFLNINARNSSLDDILSKSLKKEGISFILADSDKVILSKGYSIKTNFGKEYLDHLKANYRVTDTSGYARPTLREEESEVSAEFRLHRIGKPSAGRSGEIANLSGVVTNSADGLPVPGAVIYVGMLKAGVVTNEAGYYSLSLPAGKYQIEYRMIGMRQTNRNIVIYSDGILDVEMKESTSTLDEIIISADRENIVKNVTTGIERINVKMLRQIPMGLGEADVMKSSLLLPGVQTVGEASGGYNVRGGSADQNLVLLNNAPIINSSHFFGFFSAFNSDLISDVTLYKSGIPSKYGGRISSVMDITPAEGNDEKVKVSGGISPITGRLLIDGPLKKEKASFIIGTRTTYSDWLLGMLHDNRLKQSTAGFYDLQGLITASINERNSVSVSGYLSNDKFDYYRESAFEYGNLAATVKWKHNFNKHLTAQYYAILSEYDYRLDSRSDSVKFNTLSYKLNQKILRAEFNITPAGKHKTEFGAEAIFYSLHPGTRRPIGEYSEVIPGIIEKERAVEPSLYFSDEIEINSSLLVSGGIRGTLFTSFGPKSEFRYFEDLPLREEYIRDTITYGRGKIVKSYPGLELRLSSRLIISPGLSFKIGAQRVYQYIHMISNTTSISPTDVWKLSDRYIEPQRGDQVSAGFYGNFRRKAIETSAEVYYKRLSHILDYKGGALLLMNDHLETDIIEGNGKAYGVELMVKKQTGALTGLVSYTYSRVLLKVDGMFDEEKVNDGRYFPASYDKPHDFKIVANTRLSRRFNFTSNFVYNTGRPITFPVAFYQFNNSYNVFYSNRNGYRIPDYMRLDFSATLNGNLKARKLNHSSLTLTVYNVLGRKNPYSIFFTNEDGEVKGYQLTIFGQPVFMLTYNFRLFGNATGDF